MKIYVGNINYRTTDEELKQLFSDFGEVNSVQVITDRISGRSKGFAFVEMDDDAEAREAIEALHESDFAQRTIVVNEARPMKERSENKRGRDHQDRRRY